MAALAALGLTGASAAHAEPPPKEPLPTQDENRPEGPVRTVMPGDSLWSVATANGISVEELMEFNDLSGDASLRPGQHLRLSPPEKAKEPAPPKASASSVEDPSEVRTEPDPVGAPGPGTKHEVRPGDSLWDLAQRNDVTVAQIIEANDLDMAQGLRPGQVLQIPGAQAPGAPERPSTPKAAGDKDTPAPKPQGKSQKSPERVTNNFPGYDYDDETVASANDHLNQLRQRPAPSPAAMEAMVRSTAIEMGVDPAVALAHAEQESAFRHQVVSPADAIGTMQVVPAAGEWAESLVGRDLDLLDPQDNVTAGVAIIRENTKRAEGRDEAIAAYYQGLHGVQEYGMYSDTKRYVSEVKAKVKGWS